ncbi:hypothetical protein B0H17DRAFT_1197649 [Mycena rosella]|uniref:Uncharacterized protein n=1 Tax=Mycena rosella TaxID=1033263 RepID=A0AAD7GM17_MYCRO|nr:hypothetical protein B0H17DRAFT_1197649 [Mycena rosella]
MKFFATLLMLIPLIAALPSPVHNNIEVIACDAELAGQVFICTGTCSLFFGKTVQDNGCLGAFYRPIVSPGIADLSANATTKALDNQISSFTCFY